MKLLGKNRKSGQALLLLLILVIAATAVTMVLISQSVTKTKIAQDEKQALRAFNAAEAGIEEALKDIAALPANPTAIAEYLVPGGKQISLGGGVETVVNIEEQANDYEMEIDEENGVAQIILAGAVSGPGAEIKLYWGRDDDPGDCMSEKKASLETIVYSESGGNYSFDREGYNACTLSNGFYDPVLETINSKEEPAFKYHYVLSLSGFDFSKDKLIRIRALYNPTHIYVLASNFSLPVQQYNIFSRTGETGEKVIQVNTARSVEALPPIFDYALFSGAGIN